MSKKQNINLHDRFFKSVFSRREEAIAFLKGTLSPEMFAKINIESVQTANTTYISRELLESISDVVYEAQFDGFPIKLAFIIEHKSFVPKLPFLQLLMYFVNCIQTQVKQTKKGQKVELALPIIIVLYHGKDEWVVKPISQYFGDVPVEIQHFIPIFDYLLVNLQKETYQKIKQRYESLKLRISLMSMKGAFDAKGFELSMFSVFEGVEQVFTNEDGSNFFKELAHYILEKLEIDTDKFYETIHTQTNNGGEQLMTIANKLRKEGRQQGRQEGFTEGIEKGIRKANYLNAIKCLKQNLDNKTIEIITTLSEKEIVSLRKTWNEKGEMLIEEMEKMETKFF